MKIIVHNIDSQLVIGGKDHLLGFDVEQLFREMLRVRKDGYDRTEAYRQHRWDGYTSLINKNLHFATGFLPAVTNLATSKGIEFELLDERENLVEVVPAFVNDLYNSEGWKLMELQEQGVKVTLANSVAGVPFLRGVANAATNYGKTSYMAGVIHNLVVPETFGDIPQTIILCDRDTFFNGTLKFMRDIFGDLVGEVSKKRFQLDKRVVVAMVGTLVNRLEDVNTQQALARFRVMFLDECHRGGAEGVIKCTQKINAYVRLFVSGTPFDITSKYKKLMQIAQSGGELFKVSNMDLIEKDVSLPPICKFHLCPDGFGKTYFDYSEEYNELIVNSRAREEIMLNDILAKRKFTLVVVKERTHGQRLHDYFVENFPPDYVCDFTHGKEAKKVKEEKEANFRNGKTNCLICTSILQEGANLPLIQSIWYAKGGKDKVSLKQFYGRSARKGSEGDYVEFNDFFDVGAYVSKHSRKRIKDLKKEGFQVTFDYKHNRQFTPVR